MPKGIFFNLGGHLMEFLVAIITSLFLYGLSSKV